MIMSSSPRATAEQIAADRRNYPHDDDCPRCGRIAWEQYDPATGEAIANPQSSEDGPHRRCAGCGYTEGVVITRDGKYLANVADSNAAFAWLLTHQGQSVHYALRYGGYRVLGPDGQALPEFTEYARRSR